MQLNGHVSYCRNLVPSFLDGKGVVVFQVLLLVVIDELAVSSVLSTGEQSGGGLIPSMSREGNLVRSNLGGKASKHLLLFNDSNSLAVNRVAVLETRDDFMLDPEGDFDFVGACLFQRERVALHGVEGLCRVQVVDNVTSRTIFENDSHFFDNDSARVIGGYFRA